MDETAPKGIYRRYRFSGAKLTPRSGGVMHGVFGQNRWQKVLFHESAESFERTTHHKQYLPAHATAIRREAIWMQQKPSLLRFAPGAGPIRFYSNRVDKAK